MKILMIGGAGSIGAHLLKKLLDDRNIARVDLIDNFSKYNKDIFIKNLIKNKKVFVLKKNIINLNPKNFIKKDYDIIYQLAAMLGVRNVINNPEKVLIDNVLIMKNSIEIAKKQTKLKKFIFFSTSEVYAGTLENFSMKFPTPESTPLSITNLINPRTSYMLSKLYCEAMCIHSNLKYLILRPHNIYGPRMGTLHVIPQLIQKIHNQKNNIIKLNSSTHKRAFCYIDDAVNQIYLITKQKIINKTFNIGNPEEEISIIGLCEKIIKLLRRKNLRIIKIYENNFSPMRRLPDMNHLFKFIKKTRFTKLELGLIKTVTWYLNIK
jgi:nucleoside-diphosphate-sugar epimerase